MVSIHPIIDEKKEEIEDKDKGEDEDEESKKEGEKVTKKKMKKMKNNETMMGKETKAPAAATGEEVVEDIDLEEEEKLEREYSTRDPYQPSYYSSSFSSRYFVVA